MFKSRTSELKLVEQSLKEKKATMRRNDGALMVCKFINQIIMVFVH